MKRLMAVALVIALGVSALISFASPSSAAASGSLTPPERVYFPETGHTLSYGFLRFWHSNGDLAIFGYPISEEMLENGLTVQYFERARFEYHAELPAPNNVLLTLLGSETAKKVDAQMMHGMTLDKNDVPGRVYFPETGHTLAFGFKTYWENNGGLTIFGYPISEERQENGQTVQYFERARFEYHPEFPEPGNVLLTHLGRMAAQAKGISTAAVPQDPNVPSFSADLWPKWIEVNLSTQTLVAHEGDRAVMTTLISSGLYYPTPTGTYYIERKLVYDRMTGGTRGYDYYDLPDVPYVMYFVDGYSLHGTYWHNNFGYPMSHGCVNMPTPKAEWTFGWAPYGTPVVIHY